MKLIKYIIYGLNLYKIKIIKRISYLYSLLIKMIVEFFYLMYEIVVICYL